MKNALAVANLTMSQMDLIEINEGKFIIYEMQNKMTKICGLTTLCSICLPVFGVPKGVAVRHGQG